MAGRCLLALACFHCAAAVTHMNSREYLIANAPDGEAKTRSFRGEWFEMYGTNQASSTNNVLQAADGSCVCWCVRCTDNWCCMCTVPSKTLCLL